jgi:hypothetical protein
MGGSRIPGPLGSDTNWPIVDWETMARWASPLPGPIGQNPLDGSAVAPAPAHNDPEIEALNLAATARAAAYALKKAHPAVKFTSGRRNKADQARAMAGNVVKNRKWIEETYSNTPLRKKCQDWVDDHPDKKTKTEIAQGLLSVFDSVTDAELGTISKHLSGMAFDVQPVTTDAAKIKETIRGLAGLHKFLDKEGGLVRWHAQFK